MRVAGGHRGRAPQVDEKVLFDLGEEEIKKAILLGNVVSQYVEGTLDEIIMHRERERTVDLLRI